MASDKVLVKDPVMNGSKADESLSSSYLLADRLAIGFLIITGFLLLLYSASDTVYLKFGLGNLVGAWLIWQAARRDPGVWIKSIFRVGYPVAIIAVSHVEVELFIHMIYGTGFTFDALVSRWDALLFGLNPHLYFHTLFTQWHWVELMHLLYINYYFLLIGSILWVYLKRADEFSRFVFIYMGIFLTFVVIFSLFPVIGPVAERNGIFAETSLMANLVDFLFLIGAPDGAAFPSSHVGQSVGIYLLLQPLSRYANIGIGLVILGIGISMVYVFIHFAIDALAGLIAGWILYHIWDRVYRYLKS